MGLMAEYFADSYALVEYVKGNKNYAKYFRDNRIITTRLNLMELFYSTLITADEELAEKYYDSFSSHIIEFGDETAKEATKFKYLHKKKKISYVDALGYQISIDKGIKFLTGDKQFENLAGVEFVK